MSTIKSCRRKIVTLIAITSFVSMWLLLMLISKTTFDMIGKVILISIISVIFSAYSLKCLTQYIHILSYQGKDCVIEKVGKSSIRFTFTDEKTHDIIGFYTLVLRSDFSNFNSIFDSLSQFIEDYKKDHTSIEYKQFSYDIMTFVSKKFQRDILGVLKVYKNKSSCMLFKENFK
jgi:hypothetical protein